MSLFSFLAAFLLLRRLRKSLTDPYAFKRWDKILNYSSWITAGMFLVLNILKSDIAQDLFGLLCLVGIIIFIYKKPDFIHARQLVRAIFPYVIIYFLCYLIKYISPVFYDQWDNYASMAIIAGFIWIFAIWANYNKQQKALEFERRQRQLEEEEKKIVTVRKNELEILVAERTAELTNQKEELQHTVKELQVMQAQLVQQEKLASLGELTAGIAHEIQNPLNFVNNFSDVSVELLAEMRDELKNGNGEEAIAIAVDIEQNLQKISHHGKRADAIVKGMLQHSRKNTGQKEPTDINALADEYLRLSFHGLRAKDKSFNANFKTHFDESIGKIEVVPQDMGRVLLNLFNNAFYAVNEKKKQAGEAYNPVVSVSTKTVRTAEGSEISITVKDNGNGIPQEAAEKIFQPFFTTKPTGQGTGLGLSLSYDIITKVHGGEIKVETKEGEGAKFIITLPVKEKV